VTIGCGKWMTTNVTIIIRHCKQHQKEKQKNTFLFVISSNLPKQALGVTTVLPIRRPLFLIKSDKIIAY